MTYDKKEFPPLTLEPTANSATSANTSTPQNAKPPLMTPPTAAYDYRAELNRITAKIENNLKPKFDNLFAQIESKITKLAEQQMQQYAEQMKQYAEQQKVNAQNAQQLAWVIDNMKKFFKYAHPNLTFMSHHCKVMGKHNESIT